MTGQRFDPSAALSTLTGFQRATVDHIMNRFFGPGPTRRFLTADETGLGKSLIAKGVIASLIDRLQDDDKIKRIDIVYICSNTDIAEQNLTRLNVTGERSLPFASRLTLLAKESHRLSTNDGRLLKPVNLVAFTPGTSLNTGQSTGKAEERALISILLNRACRFDGWEQHAADMILRRGVSKESFDRTLRTLDWQIERRGLDPIITKAFARAITANGQRRRFRRLVRDLGRRRKVPAGYEAVVRDLIGDLRTTLAKASVDSFEPDLIILDEFQRFRHLLDLEDGGPAAVLAHDLFDHSDARVLLLSATPYKPFTYAEEKVDGEDHHADFLTTLRFLASQDKAVTDGISRDLTEFRSAAARDADPTSVTSSLRSSLLQLMCRTERPQVGDGDMLHEPPAMADELGPDDILDLAALRAIAKLLNAPFSLDFWKSVPYFVNFMQGYKIDAAFRAALDDPVKRRDLERLVTSTRHLDRQAIARGERLDPGNARLRRLQADTVDQGWSRLLWMPPSLPYLQPSGPYAEPAMADITKRLVFSSWTATPTAVAALLSYEAQRATASAVGSNTQRLAFRVTEDGPGAMTTLALLWPNPALALLTDPLVSATTAEAPRTPDDIELTVAQSIAPLIGPDGESDASAAQAWRWLAPFRLDGAIPQEVLDDLGSATAALEGSLGGADDSEAEADGEPGEPGRLRAHLDLAAKVHDIDAPELRPTDLAQTTAELGLHGPGNIAWRAIARQLGPTDLVTESGHWLAAATIASGIRSLFNRPEVAALLDQLDPDPVYWQAVLRYCRAGNLQAVLDEYVHHRVASDYRRPLDDAALLKLAGEIRNALSLRPAPYTAFDPTAPDEPITFQSRFALRYGNRQQSEAEGVRQPAVRAAFNSPFWPFVLASTSVGQEGIDLHWWCHAVVHWNTPSNPVDFDQREGRVHRYGGHAIRKNVAARHRATMLAPGVKNPWATGYEAAHDRQADLGELAPYWVYPGPAKVLRITPSYPLSIDIDRLRDLKDDVALYRLTLGQPRQEDLLDLLRRNGVALDQDKAARLRLDLTPPRGLGQPGAVAASPTRERDALAALPVAPPLAPATALDGATRLLVRDRAKPAVLKHDLGYLERCAGIGCTFKLNEERGWVGIYPPPGYKQSRIGGLYIRSGRADVYCDPKHAAHHPLVELIANNGVPWAVKVYLDSDDSVIQALAMIRIGLSERPTH